MDSIFEELKEKQKEAVYTIDNDLEVLACAGSGKTRVVASRIIHILKTRPEIKPENIVAFTYTEKAASELKNRIYAYAERELNSTTAFADMYIGTIHGFCLKLLQDYVEGFQAFELLDPIRLKLFVEKNYNFIGMRDLELKIYTETDIFISVMSIMNENFHTDKMPKDLIDANNKYSDFLLNRKYFDFSLILKKTYDFLTQSASLRSIIKDKIKFLTVDEYQDVNPIQESIIEIIHKLGANLCVVGDDDQTIYQFRGSEAANILDFSKKYGIERPIYLEENFRSNPGIVDVASTIIVNNKRRFNKSIRAVSSVKYEEGDIVYNDFESAEDEFEFIAERIKNLKDSGMNYSDIAILARKRKIIPKLTTVLTNNEIPFIVDGLNELFETKEIIACVKSFNYLNHEGDEKELFDAWKCVHAKIDDEDIDTMISHLDTYKINDLKYGSQLVLQQIFYDILQCIELFEDDNSTDKMIEVIMYNLGKFSQVINDFESIYYGETPKFKILKFCGFLKFTAINDYSEGLVENTYVKPEAVQIMTVHAAKGLEFPTVFIPQLNKNFFPSRKQADHIWDKIIPREAIVNAERFIASEEDERKLFYVAVTRAQKLLFLTRAPGNSQEIKSSIFFEEAKHSSYIFKYNDRIDYKTKLLISLKCEPRPIILNFSVLQNYFECPYKFKLSFIYKFIQPLVQPLGYGKSLHDIVMNIHNNYLQYGVSPKEAIPDIVSKCFNVPYATETMRTVMREKATKAIEKYYDKNSESFDDIIFAEKDIELDMGENVMVSGRIDLVKRKDIDGSEKTFIVDFKSSDRAPSEEIKSEQLQIYSAGYRALTGENADFVEVYNLDANQQDREKVTDMRIGEVLENVKKAANDIRTSCLGKCRGDRCKTCFYKKICNNEN